MSLSNHLERLKSLLSEQDLFAFEQLNQKLMDAKGDLTALSDADLSLIEQMEQKYGDQIRDTAVEHADEVIKESHFKAQQIIKDEFPLLKTEFAEYVKDLLFRELSERFTSLEEMVAFAFNQKWIPQELKNPDVCETLYERFFSDINSANEWRSKMQGGSENIDNKTLAVGLTWFMYIYQLKQSLN